MQLVSIMLFLYIPTTTVVKQASLSSSSSPPTQAGLASRICACTCACVHLGERGGGDGGWGERGGREGEEGGGGGAIMGNGQWAIASAAEQQEYHR